MTLVVKAQYKPEVKHAEIDDVLRLRYFGRNRTWLADQQVRTVLYRKILSVGS